MNSGSNKSTLGGATVTFFQLILEYIRVLIWPVLLVVAFLVYEDKLFNIIENREVDAFGLKIGKEVGDISKAYKEQIAVLKQQIEKQSGSQELLDRVDSIELNLDKQLTHVKSSALQEGTSLVKVSKKEQVELYERQGFEAIIDKDVTTAIDNFTDAAKLWPDFHNVSEIQKLLVNNRVDLENKNNIEAWQVTVKTILQKYSWGMPSDIRQKLAQFAS